MSQPTPFTITVPQERLDEIRARVAGFDWHSVPDAGGWKAGVGIEDMKRLCDHWLNRFNWRDAEAKLNLLPQFTAEVNGAMIHFVHARGNGSKLPIMLVHGWPGSFTEFEKLVAPLVADGHDVIVPSLPGYAFSGRPKKPIGPKRTAELFHKLLTDVLGYERALLQGGDWGAAVTGWMAHDYPDACAGLHLNMVLIHRKDAQPETAEEQAWARKREELNKEEGGYSHLQGTRPQTLGFAMADDPVGIAAWVLEKFGVWADVEKRADGSPDLWQAFSEDQLLTNIMLYVAPRSFVSSTWMYKGRMDEGSATFPAGSRVSVPTAVAAFPDPVFPPPPRSHAEKSYAIMRWTEMKKGGHFAALEQPGLWLEDVRAFVAGV